MNSKVVTQPEWAYFELELITENNRSQGSLFDILTWNRTITSALSKLFGNVGEAIHFDILHHFFAGNRQACIVRVPCDYRDRFQAAVAGFQGSLDSLGTDALQCGIHVVRVSNSMTGVSGPRRF
ncbi:Hypothetical protein YALI2_F00720g [Yarrowia lipolytica]|nr:Hypothetical protein YALI2_F00720g [Yarrowia lipolytica]